MNIKIKVMMLKNLLINNNFVDFIYYANNYNSPKYSIFVYMVQKIIFKNFLDIIFLNLICHNI